MTRIEAVLFDFTGVVANVRPALIGEDGPLWRIEPVHEVVAGILRLRSAGYTTCLVSNNDRQALLSEATSIDFDALFDHMVFSSDEGFAKPDVRIYRAALRVVGADEDRCVFVDDLARNVDAATAVGMKGVVAESVTSVVTLIEDLIDDRRDLR